MALSQIQCLDDNHVNWRMNESKPEFFYSEEQRLALEALIASGRDAFHAYVSDRELRPFLSEPELERLCRSVEDYRPGSEHIRPEGAGEAEDGAVSLQYWPDRSDASIPDLDLGWPDCNSYRGVTRVNVYTQPPFDGQTHIKEVVRKTIAQAQKVIAVVMDVFTDVDIFKDLLDAGFKRKVAVYIIIEQASIQHFLSMCERANMHRGHLKHLRVRCSGGCEFHTRSAKKVQGSLNQRFMFVDGDRAVSGSYSFTWTASRLDRNLITVLTGQAVETFDKQFRELYLTSRGVSLSKVPLADLPDPDPTPVPAPAPLPSAALARKLINPKYALVDTASRTSSDKISPKNSSSQNPLPQPVKRQREVVEELPKHPGLVGLPKAELISYLPIWPEPDPPSDVIGFINIRDTSKPLQVHLMRSQLFETSQAIRFKDPFTGPPEQPLPEKASPRTKATNAPKTKPPQNTSAQPEDQPKMEVLSENHAALADNTSPPAQTENQGTKADAPASPQPQSTPQPTQPIVEETQSDGPPPGPPPGPPVPKPRTLQLVMNPTDGSEAVQVSFVKKEQPQQPQTVPDTVSPPPCIVQEASSSDEYREAPEEPTSTQTVPNTDQSSKDRLRDNDADSTKVMCAHSVKDKDESSTASDEYYECSDSENLSVQGQLANGRTTGSGRFGDHSPGTDSLNMMARLSQSMLDLRPENCAEPDPAERNLLNIQSKYPGKAYQPVSRSPVREQSYYNRAKVVIAKPGVFHRPPKSSAHVIGGHRYWQGKLYGPERPQNRLSQPEANRTGRSPRRHGSPFRTGGLRTSQSPVNRIVHAHSRSPAHQVSHTHSPSPRRRNEMQTPLGISFSKLASFRNLRGKVPGVIGGVAMGDKRVTRGHKNN
ncbi:protein FAM83G [Colossoma macropomum]|uniref:protein FAM83G n=1 Tax=Colossoma macropomum TaxID=42526 RepID=UPI00186405B3|nr:protein FAM83G [Colossoma macropomum]